MHDHCSSASCGTGGVGIPMAIGGLGKRDQHGGCATHGQFTQAAGAGSADGQIGMLQQRWNVVAEGAFREEGCSMLLTSGSLLPVRCTRQPSLSSRGSRGRTMRFSPRAP